MARLPQQGGDEGNWGTILNDFLLQSLKTDGSLKEDVVTSTSLAPNAVNTAAIADGTITEALLANPVQTKLNASPVIADGSIIKTKLSSSVQTSLNAADAAVSPAILSQFVAGAGPYTSVVPSRPTAGAFVIWNGTADPGANAMDGDFWIAP